MNGLKTDDRRADEGFTLLETLIAFMILAMALTILLQSIGQATTQIRNSDQVETSRQLASRAMVIARADKRPSAGGTDKQSGLLWKWARMPVIRQDRNGTLSPVYLITVEIRRPSQDMPVQVLKSVQLADPEK